MKLRISSIFSRRARRARWVWSGVLVAVVAFYGASVVCYAVVRQTVRRSKGADIDAVWIGLGAVGWNCRRYHFVGEVPAAALPRLVEHGWGGREPTAIDLPLPGEAVPLRWEVYDVRDRSPYGLGALEREHSAERLETRVAVPLWPLIVIALVPTIVSWRRQWRERRRERSLCGCGYSRVGLPPEGLCPECGAGAAG